MSKYNNELHKHKAADAIKWIVVFVLILAIVGAVVCIGLQLGGVFDFFKKDDVSTDEQTEAADDSNIVATVESSAGDNFPSEDMPVITMAMTAAVDTNQRTLVATVLPENADQTVEWKIEYVDPSSDFAQANDINSIMSISSQGLRATVTCLKAFGEQIKVTCVSASNAERKAVCTFDYVAKKQAKFYVLRNGGLFNSAVVGYAIGFENVTPYTVVDTGTVNVRYNFGNFAKKLYGDDIVMLSGGSLLLCSQNNYNSQYILLSDKPTVLPYGVPTDEALIKGSSPLFNYVDEFGRRTTRLFSSESLEYQNSENNQGLIIKVPRTSFDNPPTPNDFKDFRSLILLRVILDDGLDLSSMRNPNLELPSLAADNPLINNFNALSLYKNLKTSDLTISISFNGQYLSVNEEMAIAFSDIGIVKTAVSSVQLDSDNYTFGGNK